MIVKCPVLLLSHLIQRKLTAAYRQRRDDVELRFQKSVDKVEWYRKQQWPQK